MTDLTEQNIDEEFLEDGACAKTCFRIVDQNLYGEWFPDTAACCGAVFRLALYPGVAQLVARVIWDHEAQSSNLCTRTKLFEAHGSIIFGTETKSKI